LNNSLINKFQKIAISIFNLDRFDENQFGPSGGRELRKLQIKSVYSHTSAMMLGNIMFATLLTANLLGKGLWQNVLAISWCIILVCVSLFTLRKSKSRAKLKKEYSGSEKSIRNLIISSAILSTLWCMPIIFFYSITNGIERGVITAIMTGILAAGAISLARVPKAAYTWLAIAGAIHCFVALFTGLRTGELADFSISIFSVIATFGMFASVSERTNSFFTAFANTQSIKEKSEVIDLLLKDYESQSTGNNPLARN